MIKEWIKSFLSKTPARRNILQFIQIRKSAFDPCSKGSFTPLDKLFRPKTIDIEFAKAFDRIFVLQNSFRLQGDILEFGVFRGYTARILARNIKKFHFANTKLHLFDSFEGLPNAKELDKNSYEVVGGHWYQGLLTVTEGLENYLHKKLAKILSKERVCIVKGFFENTMESYFKNKNIKAKILHLDCDFYSSSKYVMEFLLNKEVIQDGTLLIFDDWMTSLGNPNLGQRKAVSEVLEQYPHWSFEKYFSYGIGSHVFIAHDLRVIHASNIPK